MILRPATLDLSLVRLCSERIARRKTDNETGNEDRRNGTRGLTRSLDSLCLDIISMIFRFEDYLTTFAVCVVSTVVLKWFMIANQFTNVVYNFVFILWLFQENLYVYMLMRRIFLSIFIMSIAKFVGYYLIFSG